MQSPVLNGGIYNRSNTNRMVTPDTIVPEPGNSQAYNRYAYVLNNPTNLVDPSGHCAEDPYFDSGGCWELQSWIQGELESGTKYFVFDGVIFDMAHAETNWRLARSIYEQWATGHVNLEWSGFELTYEVDFSLTGEARDQAAFNLWLDFVTAKEVSQGIRLSASWFSQEDMASNYVT